jgi:glycosyltransferase involved in cell wall biosynthesis
MHKSKRNNKILVNAASIRTGGSETFLRNILPLIAERLPDITFYVLLRESRLCQHTFNAINVTVVAVPDVSLGSSLKKLLFEHVTIIRYHLKFKTRIHWQMDELLSPVLFLFGIRTIAVFHSTPMVFLKHLTNDGFVNDTYMALMRRLTAMLATVPVCVSNHARAELNGLYPCIRNRIQVIYHGVNHELYSPGAPDTGLLKKYCLDRKYILSISNRFVWKNYYRLVQSFQMIRDKKNLTDIDLVLIGEEKNASEELRIREFIDRHGLADAVKIIPFIDQSLLHHFYKGAWVYVFSSMEETFGLTVLEALACGIPVACANWGVIPEVAGTAAAYFDPLDTGDMRDVIADVCSNEQKRHKLITTGLLQCSRFNWESTANGYAKAVRKLNKENRIRK